MKNISNMIIMTILASVSVGNFVVAQNASSRFFSSSVDTRDAPATGDSMPAWAPSVPLGYPTASGSNTPEAAKTTSDPVSKITAEQKKAFISFAAATKTLTLVIPRSQNVLVSAHVLNGQSISRFSTRKFLTAGTHTIKLGNAALANGIIVFRVEGEGFSLVKRINLMDEH